MPRRILLMASLLAMLVPAAVRADAPPVWLLGQFNGVNGVAVTPDGVVFVVDKNNHRIQKFGPAVVPTVKTSWGRVKALYH